MKRVTIATVFTITIIGLAACGDSIAGPDIPTPPGGFVEVDQDPTMSKSAPAVAEARSVAHRKARMGRNPRTGQTIHIP
jgi:hypothetical protein